MTVQNLIVIALLMFNAYVWSVAAAAIIA